MNARKTRRSISFRAEIYVSAGRAADEADQPLAAWVEDAVRQKLASQGAPVCSRPEALKALGIPPNPRRQRVHTVAQPDLEPELGTAPRGQPETWSGY